MSVEERMAVVNSPNTLFTADSQRKDLLNEQLTNTYLIGLIQHLLASGHIIEFTAVRSDHHDDGPHGHAGGYAFDCWPLASASPGTFLSADAPGMHSFLADAAAYPNIYQIGLAGSANTVANQRCVGDVWFPDSGADHVHLGIEDWLEK